MAVVAMIVATWLGVLGPAVLVVLALALSTWGVDSEWGEPLG